MCIKIWCYIVRAQLLGERPKGKYSTAKQSNGQRGFEIVLKLGKCHLFRWIHTLNLFLLQTYSHLASETRTNSSTFNWWMGKNPLESYWGDYLVIFKGVSQLSLVNETITSKAYQDYIKSDIKTPTWMHYAPSIQQDNAPCNSSLYFIQAFTRAQGGEII